MPAGTVLFVCYANRCRSPLGEGLFRWLAAARGVEVRTASAGVGAYPGRPIEPEAAEELARRGAPPLDHRSRRLAPEHLEGIDLVLTASAEQRDQVGRMVPAAFPLSFAILELPQLLEGPAGSLAELATQAAARRRINPILDIREVEDPIGAKAKVYRRVADELVTGLTPVVEALVPG